MQHHVAHAMVSSDSDTSQPLLEHTTDLDIWLQDDGRTIMSFRYLHPLIPNWVGPVKIELHPEGDVRTHFMQQQTHGGFQGTWYRQGFDTCLDLQVTLLTDRRSPENPSALEWFHASFRHNMMLLENTHVFKDLSDGNIILTPWTTFIPGPSFENRRLNNHQQRY
jgi:hypothetical protein